MHSPLLSPSPLPFPLVGLLHYSVFAGVQVFLFAIAGLQKFSNALNWLCSIKLFWLSLLTYMYKTVWTVGKHLYGHSVTQRLSSYLQRFCAQPIMPDSEASVKRMCEASAKRMCESSVKQPLHIQLRCPCMTDMIYSAAQTTPYSS